MKSNLKILYWVLGILALLVISFYFISLASFSWGRSYSRQEAIDNFKEREKAILAIADYFRRQKPDTNEVLFEVDGSHYTISIALPNWAISPEHPYNAGRDMKINSAKMDSLLSTLRWTTETVLTLKEMLRKANSPYVSSDGNYIHLHYRTGTWTSYWYTISDKPFADSVIKQGTEAGVMFLRNNVRIGSSSAL